MGIDNEFNREQYNRYTDEYLSSNVDHHIGGGTTESRLALLQDYLPVGSSILEIGAGAGDDAVALSESGYVVTASDFSEKFVEILDSKDLSALQFDAKLDEFPEGYDAVYANAVLVHFSPEETLDFLKRAQSKLSGSKLVFLSVIMGDAQERRVGSNISFERDFQDYTEDSLQAILEAAGFEVRHIELVDQRWLQVIATSKS